MSNSESGDLPLCGEEGRHVGGNFDNAADEVVDIHVAVELSGAQ